MTYLNVNEIYYPIVNVQASKKLNGNKTHETNIPNKIKKGSYAIIDTADGETYEVDEIEVVEHPLGTLINCNVIEKW